MVKGKNASLLALGLGLGVSGTAAAQERGRVGLTVAHPASVGLIWHPSDRVAIRPDLNLSWTASETEGPTSVFVTLGSPARAGR
jgi:hypothetical protein